MVGTEQKKCAPPKQKYFFAFISSAFYKQKQGGAVLCPPHPLKSPKGATCPCPHATLHQSCIIVMKVPLVQFFVEYFGDLGYFIET